MLNSITPDAAKAAATFCTRREALLTALKGTAAAAVATLVIAQAATTAPTSPPDSEFVPENDYPFFGCDPDSLA